MRDIKNDPMQSSVEVDDGSMHTITRRFKDPEEMQPDPLHVTVKTRVPPPEKPEPVVRPISPDNLPEQPHAVPEIEGLWKVEKKKREINAGELSKFEQRMMDEAHERHKTQLTKDQHVWGKKYEGPGFLCDPPVLRFIDFHVDKVYKRKLIITNVSYTFNFFKMLELDDMVKNFFDVKFSPPGRMSAGLTCEVWVTFEPKLNEDIVCEVPFLGETGPFALKIECTTPKVELYFKPEEQLDLGEVEMDQQNMKVLTITNRGNLGSKFTVKHLASHSMLDGAEYDGFREVCFPETGVIEPCEVLRDKGGNVIDDHVAGRNPSKCLVPITFTPIYAGKLDVTLEIEFDDPNTPSFVLRVVGQGKLVPIYFEIPSMPKRPHCPQHDDVLMDQHSKWLARCDFETCVMSHFYRDLVLLKNRGSTALKCQAVVPKPMQDYVELHPDMCYVQAHSDFPVQIKFTPDEDMIQAGIDNGHITGEVLENDTCSVKIPISILVPDRQPVNLVIVAQITSPHVRFSTTEVDFGSCAIAEAVRVPVTIQNMACLPQEVAFVNLPKEINVEPLEGFVSLLPYPDSFTFDLLFQPSVATEFSANVVFKTLWNHETKLKVKGVGTQPPLVFSQPVIKFAAVPQQQLQSHYVLLENVTKKRRQFEFGIPDDWPVRVFPTAGHVGPKEKLRVRLDFTSSDADNADPPVSPGADPTDPGSRPPSRKPGSEFGAQGELLGVDAAEEESPLPDADITNGDNRDDGEQAPDEEAAPASKVLQNQPQVNMQPVKKDRWETFTLPCFIRDWADQCIYLEMQTCVFHSPLVAECDGADDFGGTSLQFGELALGQTMVRKIRFWNYSREICDIAIAPVLIHGPFRLLSGVAPIEPGGFLDVQLQFKPDKAARYAEYLRVSSKLANLAVTLRGVGVVPSLRLEPSFLEDLPEDGSPVVFDVGDGLVHEPLERAITIINNSDQFELVFSIHAGENAHTNLTSITPFDCVPNTRTIARSGREDVLVRFAPDHESWRYSQIVTVEIPGQKPKPINFVAQSWARSLFIKGGDIPEDEVDDPFADDDDVEEANKTITATFRASGSTREFQVGNLEAKDPSKKNDKGEVEFVLPPEAASLGFQIDPVKFVLNPGDPHQIVTVSFNPPVDDGQLLKGEWVEASAKCNLKGGYFLVDPADPKSAQPAVTVDLVLKGLVT